MAGPENIKLEELLDKIDEALESISQPEPQPEGSLSIDQYAELKGISRHCAKERLSRLFKAGKIERIKWTNKFVYFFRQPDATVQHSPLVD